MVSTAPASIGTAWILPLPVFRLATTSKAIPAAESQRCAALAVMRERPRQCP
jgi:hypothetical protein